MFSLEIRLFGSVRVVAIMALGEWGAYVSGTISPPVWPLSRIHRGLPSEAGAPFAALAAAVLSSDTS